MRVIFNCPKALLIKYESPYEKELPEAEGIKYFVCKEWVLILVTRFWDYIEKVKVDPKTRMVQFDFQSNNYKAWKARKQLKKQARRK